MLPITSSMIRPSEIVIHVHQYCTTLLKQVFSTVNTKQVNTLSSNENIFVLGIPGRTQVWKVIPNEDEGGLLLGSPVSSATIITPLNLLHHHHHPSHLPTISPSHMNNTIVKLLRIIFCFPYTDRPTSSPLG